MTPSYPPTSSNAHRGLDGAGVNIHVDVVALTARLEEFDRRISQVKARQLLVDARTAAIVLDAAELF